MKSRRQRSRVFFWSGFSVGFIVFLLGFSFWGAAPETRANFGCKGLAPKKQNHVFRILARFLLPKIHNFREPAAGAFFKQKSRPKTTTCFLSRGISWPPISAYAFCFLAPSLLQKYINNFSEPAAGAFLKKTRANPKATACFLSPGLSWPPISAYALCFLAPFLLQRYINNFSEPAAGAF